MGIFKTEFTSKQVEGEEIELVKEESFKSFNEQILDLGDINSESKPINCISVMFDLEGFTNFCKQIDPHLAVPEYLSEFLKWIFEALKKELTKKEYAEGVEVWANPAFLTKFLGDGLLFLWDSSSMSKSEIHNVVVSMYEVCRKYSNQFYPNISKKIINPPSKLRCGIARGLVYSVGNGNDFVGPCINMSARLQKLHSLSFCFSKRGFDPSTMSENYAEKFVVKEVEIRGIGEKELVCILKSEYEMLDNKSKKLFN